MPSIPPTVIIQPTRQSGLQPRIKLKLNVARTPLRFAQPPDPSLLVLNYLPFLLLNDFVQDNAYCGILEMGQKYKIFRDFLETLHFVKDKTIFFVFCEMSYLKIHV